MNRIQRRHQTLCDQYRAGQKKPPTRAQARAWLAPIRKAFIELLGGEVDAVRGYAITRIRYADEDFARIDHAINGFVALIERLMPDFDISGIRKISVKLENGILFAAAEVHDALALLKRCEDRLIKIKRRDLTDAAKTEMINIELERLGIKEAA